MPDINKIAEVCHEANRVLQRHTGEVVNFPWENTSEQLRASSREGVLAVLEGATPEELHEQWRAEREANGWVFGPIKDFATKQHPCLVSYDDLPYEHQVKDALFFAIVKGLS